MPPLSTTRRDLAALTVALGLILAWEAGGWDLALTRAVAGPAGFALRDAWWTRGLLHDGGRAAGWAVVAMLGWNVWHPLPFARRLDRAERVWWLATALACAGLVAAIKAVSQTPCPWSLAEFGGSQPYASHWAWGVGVAAGGCFPSGHASTAFALIGGALVLRVSHPRAARAWAAGVFVAGLLFGVAQVLRGAHHASHVLWTAWICAAASIASHHAFRRSRQRRAAAERPCSPRSA